MAIKISGVLKDGMGNPIPNCTIELKSKKTSLTVITQTEARQGLDTTGAYVMQVEPCHYDVSLYVSGFPPKRVGSIEVYSDSRPGTLNDFLMMPTESDLTPELILIFQQLRNEAREAAERAGENLDAADSILTQISDIQTDVTQKQVQVSTDATATAQSKEAAAKSAQSASDSAESCADDLAEVKALTQVADDAANRATSSSAAAAGDAQRAEQAAVKAISANESAGEHAALAEAAFQAAEGIQADVTKKHTQVVADTESVMAAKKAALDAAASASADAQSSAQDRQTVSSDKQTVADNKLAAERAALDAAASAEAADEKSVAAKAEALRAQAEADKAAAAVESKQDKSTLLTAIAALDTDEDQLIYTTSKDVVETSKLTATGRDILALDSDADVRSYLDLDSVVKAGDFGLGKSFPYSMSSLGVGCGFFSYDSPSSEVPINGCGFQSSYHPTQRAQLFVGVDGGVYSRFSASPALDDAATPWRTLVYEGGYGIGGLARRLEEISTYKDWNAVDRTGIYRSYNAQNSPVSGSVFVIHMEHGGTGYSRQLAFTFTDNSNREWTRCRVGGVWNAWSARSLAMATAIDTNGFLKSASPIVKLFGDGASTSNSAAQGVTSARVREGVYRLSGSVMGFNSDRAWHLEVPNDDNGLPLIWVDYEVESSGDIIVKTYHRTHPSAPPFAQNAIDGYSSGDPIDIPAGRWVDLRVQVYSD